MKICNIKLLFKICGVICLFQAPCDSSTLEMPNKLEIGLPSMNPDQIKSLPLEPAVDVASDEASPSQLSFTTKKKVVICLFCNHSQKKIGQRTINVIYPKSDETVTKLKEIALKLDDYKLLEKVENKIVAYHLTCFSSYQVRMKRHTEEHVNSNWHEDRELPRLAFSSLATLIEEIIANRTIMYVTQLFSRYKALLLEHSEVKKCSEDFALYRSEYLEKK